MALNVRYRAEWKTEDGFEYRIDIIDNDYIDDINNLEIGMDSFDGFSLNASGNNTGSFNPILATDCVINCVVEDTAFETFIDDIVNAQEQRFFVAIYLLETIYTLKWAGLVKQELVNIEDVALPYLFQLNATDGLGQLKDIPYPATSGTYETFIDYIINSLIQTGLGQFWDKTTILRTSVNWYEDSQFSTTYPATTLDPLKVSRVSNDAFIKLNEANEIEAKSCYDVLTEIANKFRATLCLSDGLFHFIQINSLEGTVVNTRDYNIAGTNVANSMYNYKISDIIRQGSYSFLPALKSVNLKYNFKQSYYNQNLLPPQTEFETLINLGPIQGGSEESLVFIGNVQCILNLNGNTWAEIHNWIFKMRIQVGSYYLTNEDGAAEWTTNTAKRYIVKSSWWHITNNYNNNFIVSFQTPNIPASGTGYFSFDFLEFNDSNDDPVSPPNGFTSSYLCLDFVLRQNLLGGTDEGTKIFKSVNENAQNTPVLSSSVLNLPDTITGDGPNDYSVGRIQVYTSGSVWENANEDWSVGGITSEGVNINTLLCFETISTQRKPTRVYSGDIGSNNIIILPIHVLVFGGRKYIFRSGKFSANTNIWSGDWVELTVDRDHIVSIETDKNDNGEEIFAAIGSGSSIGDLQNEIISALTEIASAKSDIIANQNAIAANIADIASNYSAIVTTNTVLSAKAALITANENAIAANAAEILAKAALIAANTSNIATNTSDVATNASEIATNKNDISTNAADIATNAADIATNTADIATNTSNIASNTSRIEAIE